MLSSVPCEERAPLGDCVLTASLRSTAGPHRAAIRRLSPNCRTLRTEQRTRSLTRSPLRPYRLRQGPRPLAPPPGYLLAPWLLRPLLSTLNSLAKGVPFLFAICYSLFAAPMPPRQHSPRMTPTDIHGYGTPPSPKLPALHPQVVTQYRHLPPPAVTLNFQLSTFNSLAGGVAVPETLYPKPKPRPASDPSLTTSCPGPPGRRV